MYNSIISICILYCVFTTPSQVSFHHHLSPFILFYLPPHPSPSGNHHTVICVYEFGVCWGLFCLIPSPFSSSPTNPLPLTVHSLFSVSLFLFCLLVYFVYWIPRMSEIMWYLSFSDWFISVSIMLSRSIHAVAVFTSELILHEDAILYPDPQGLSF